MSANSNFASAVLFFIVSLLLIAFGMTAFTINLLRALNTQWNLRVRLGAPFRLRAAGIKALRAARV